MKRKRGQFCVASLIYSTLLVLGVPTAYATISLGERQTLLDLYTSTNGASWSNSSLWNGTVGTECSWFGISCDIGQNHVIGVSLDGNNLTGVLPNDINNLLSLQNFDVGNNRLTGSIPTLTGLVNLLNFNAFNNQLTGSIPTLVGLSSLQGFDAAINDLTGPIPALTGLTNLAVFSVPANELSGAIPPLAGLVSLQDFVVFNNQLTGSIPALIGLTSLFAFDADSNQLTGSIPKLIGLPNLFQFSVANTRLTGSIPKLTGLATLQIFDVGNNQLSGNVSPVPSPDNLVAGSSSLCPNSLNHTADPAWDAATGQTPWYTNCPLAASVPTEIPTLSDAALLWLGVLLIAIGYRAAHARKTIVRNSAVRRRAACVESLPPAQSSKFSIPGPLRLGTFAHGTWDSGL